MTLVKEENMKKEYIKLYANLIKKAKPDFIEVKGYMSVGYARKRLGYEKTPFIEDIRMYSKLLEKVLKDDGYKILDEHEASRVVLIGKDKEKMNIKPNEV